MDYRFRMGTPADGEEILAVTMDAFDIDEANLRYPALRALCLSAPHESRLMEREGYLVACLHIGDTHIQVGSCSVLKGDVGHVAVRHSEQAAGLGTALMRDTMQWLRDNDYHLSRLGGLTHFYSRFGYEPFPRRYVEFPVQQVHGGTRLIQPVERFTDPECPDGGLLRPFDEALDWQARFSLTDRFDRGRSGSPAPSRVARAPIDPAPADPQQLRFTYERDGQVRGILFACESPLEARDGENCFSITEFCYDPACPEAAGLLVRKLLYRVAPSAPARITSRLPFDETLGEALQQARVGFTLIEMQSATASNMIKVVNLEATLHAVSDELSRRLAGSLVADWEGTIRLRLPQESAALRLHGGTVSVCDTGKADICVSLTQAQFVKILLGIRGFGELYGMGGPPLGVREAAVMEALFCRCSTGSGPWG